MKAFIVTALAVLVGIWAYAAIKSKGKPRLISYKDPQTGKTMTIAEGTVTTGPGGNIVFEGPDIDDRTGSYLAPGAQPGTVQFPSQQEVGP